MQDYYMHNKVAEFYEVSEAYQQDFPLYDQMLTAGHKTFLELGIGTGRIARHIASRGGVVTGIELAQPMIDVGLSRLTSDKLRQNVTFIQGDMRDFELNDRFFDAIYAGEYSFANLLTLDDQLSCLRSARRHLKASGQLVLHLFLPNPAYFSSLKLGGVGGSPLEHNSPTLLPNGNQLDTTTATSYDRATQNLSARITYDEILKDNAVHRYSLPLVTHAFYPAEISLLLLHAGYRVEQTDGGFHGEPLTNESWEMVVHARATKP